MTTSASRCHRRRRLRRALTCVALAAGITLGVLGAPTAFAEQVVETDELGRVVAKYSTDDEGRRHGSYAEFHTNGNIKLRSHYRRGRLHGNYTSYHDNGRVRVFVRYTDGEREGAYEEKDERGRVTLSATYVAGKLHGTFEMFDGDARTHTQTWDNGTIVEMDGVVPHPKSKEEIRRTIEEIYNVVDPLEKAPDDPHAAGRGEALRHLMIFRYLSDVEHDGMQLDAAMNAYADAGAALCERIGHLDHTPANPGMPKDEYDFGYKGTSNSNLYMGREDIVEQVRAYMDDSDASNIDAVGHRRWCLNPRMLKTGFGISGKFGAMWSMDGSRRDHPDYDIVAFPGRGYYPAYWFQSHYAWNVSLNRKLYAKPDPARVKVKIQPIGDDYLPDGEPLELNHLKVATSGAGIPYCIIFRPAEIEIEPGQRFRVDITGLRNRGDEPADLAYVVEFFEL